MSAEFWKHGQQAELAELAGVSQSYLNDVLHRRRTIGKETAQQLEEAATSLLGYKLVPWEAWLFNQSTEHPAFFGDPIVK